MHAAVIIATLVLIAGIGAGIGLMVSDPNFMTYGIAPIAIGYIAYIFASIMFSTIRGYITNLKKFDDYKQTYDKMVKGRGYFRFWIECYHYKTTRTKKGRSSRKKVVTHTAS
jgi:hypothetical protein